MGLFKKKSDDPGELDRLKADVAAMAARLDQADTDKHALGAQVQTLVTRFDKPTPPPPAPPTPPAPAISEADLDMLRARIQRLNDRLDQVDARITSISTELANQLTELSGDLETIRVAQSQQPAVQAPADLSELTDLTGEITIAVDEIRDSQTRLANEQARYQIAFRQDLADLAERLKRG